MQNFEDITIVNPSNYEIIATVSASTSYDIDQAVGVAREKFLEWSQKSISDRVHILQQLYTLFDAQKDQIAYQIAQEMGMPISVCMQIDIGLGLSYMQGYLDNAAVWLASEIVHEDVAIKHVLHHEAYGVVAASIPWNYPFCNFMWAVIQNLVVGNTVVLKHSENCMLTTKMLEKIMKTIPELDGVCNFVYGKGKDVGNYLINSPVDMIWFTGGVQTGSVVYQAAARQGIPAILELGGSAPGIVFEDTDLSAMLEWIYIYRFINSGQTCDALKRLIVHETIFEEVVTKLTKYLETKKMGNPIDLDVEIGPLVHKKQVDMIVEQVQDAVAQGAWIMTGGQVPCDLQGAYYTPTILTNISRNMRVWKEEVFGPVLPIISFKTEQEAIDLANDTQFGLGAYVFTQNRDRMHRVATSIKSGNICINASNYVIPQVPFGGYKKSGIGRTHGKMGMQSLCRAKVISLPKI